ncbi:hypothetical protein Ddye_018891 [Dipteronia dyeriana]|uniref:START domain-containing protein n=1 Tax=Dipteronia dyeriana TaxID=168575 RepID=A0AAD9WUJ1_9ROSI|nr:hypothetical protein Ddye_018891 [Dipteronia dyeriana]
MRNIRGIGFYMGVWTVLVSIFGIGLRLIFHLLKNPSHGQLTQNLHNELLNGLRIFEAAWRPLWPQIVHEARSFFPTADWQRLSESFGEGSSHFPAEFLRRSGEWSCIIKVHARLLLPTPTVPIREYSFLRYQKQIQEDIWAITDVSDDYLDVLNPEAELEYRRGPSGIIAREMGEECCEVTWVENMEVPILDLA